VAAQLEASVHADASEMRFTAVVAQDRICNTASPQFHRASRSCGAGLIRCLVRMLRNSGPLPSRASAT